MIASIARSRSASGMTTRKFLAPPSAWTRLPAAVARRYTAFATGVDPTKETARMPGWSQMPSTTSRPPLTRFTTPGGSPHRASSPTMRRCVSGTCSEGFTRNVFPVATANGRNQSGTIAGKLNGAIAAQTPRGWRITWQSMPAAMFS